MPNSRQRWLIGSPSSRRATNRRRSSITELSFHGIDTFPPPLRGESVTPVPGTNCHLCLGPLITYVMRCDWIGAEVPPRYHGVSPRLLRARFIRVLWEHLF